MEYLDSPPVSAYLTRIMKSKLLSPTVGDKIAMSKYQFDPPQKPGLLEPVNTKFIYKGRELVLSTNLDNGSMAKIEEEGLNVFNYWPYLEEEYSETGFLWLKSRDGTGLQRANFSFLFRVDGCKGKTVTFLFHIKERSLDPKKETDVSIVYANPDFPVYSYDKRAWRRTENKTLAQNSAKPGWQIIKVTQEFSENTAYVAFQYPYGSSFLDEYIETIKASPYCKIETAGVSTDGKTIRQISITDESIPVKNKKTVWITGVQHCAEIAAAWGIEGISDFLLSNDPAASEARKKFVFKLIPVVNIDALDEGRGRIHSTGKNLNREWEKPDPISEAKTIKETMSQWRADGGSVDYFADLHGFSSKMGNWICMPFARGSEKTNNPKYEKLKGLLKKHLPVATISLNPSKDYIAAAAALQYKAISFTVDGFAYKWKGPKSTPDLSSRYKENTKIWPLEDIKACGAEYVKMFMEMETE
jgi:hypothetical protein